METASLLEPFVNMLKPSFSVLSKAKRTLLAFALFVFASNLASLGFPQLAMADEWACRSLQLQMDGAPRSQPSGRNSAQATRYAKAIAAQNTQVDKARSQLRALGCSGSVITLGGGSKASCVKLNGALRSMNANMVKLKTQYSRLSKGGGTISSRDVFKSRYIAMGCGQRDGQRVITVKADGSKKSRSGISEILGDNKPRRDQRKRAAEGLAIPGLSFSGDTYRTLCVRQCDGYYFPISFSTTKENFQRDTVACQTMCPGTEVELFMHKVPEEESEDMVSQKGKPYKAMSYAFAYRRDGVSADPSCRCQAVQGMAVLNNGIAGTSGIASLDGNNITDALETADSVPVPLPRAEALVDVLFDRETMADAAGDLNDDEIIAIFEPKIAQTNDDGSIRVVGPVFLPDPSGAIELKVPVRPLLR